MEKTYEALQQELETVKAERDLYADILDCMNEEITREDMDGKVLYANRAYREYYGLSEDDIKGLNGVDLVIPEDRHLYDIDERVTQENPEYNIYSRVYRADGEITWIQSNGTAIFDDEGNKIYYQETGRDFTALKREQEKLLGLQQELKDSILEKNTELIEINNRLQQYNDYLDNILASISEGIVVFDEDGSIEKTNLTAKTEFAEFLDDLQNQIKIGIKDNDDSPLSRLIYRQKSFDNLEKTLKNGRHHLTCFVSGVPLAGLFKEQYKGILIIKNEASVHTLVNRISGFQTNFEFNDIIAYSHQMKDVIQYAKMVAESEMCCLIEGETGTGKEMMAQSIHSYSRRAGKPFIAINCGAIPSSLVESEFFGYVEGTFTGGVKGGKPGKFELADGGTIFLDEIGELPLENQSSLLRVLQEQKVVRIGGGREIPVNVRVVAATNKNLVKEVDEGRFRKDLYYRLNTVTVKIPALRDRKEDIRGLVKFFVRENETGKLEQMGFSEDVFSKMEQYSWPGNIRQLQGFIQKVRFMTEINNEKDSEASIEDARDIVRNEVNQLSKEADTTGNVVIHECSKSTYESSADEKVPLKSIKEGFAQAVDRSERDYIERVLEICDGNLSMAARKMGLSRSTLYRRVKSLGIRR